MEEKWAVEASQYSKKWKPKSKWNMFEKKYTMIFFKTLRKTISTKHCFNTWKNRPHFTLGLKNSYIKNEILQLEQTDLLIVSWLQWIKITEAHVKKGFLVKIHETPDCNLLLFYFLEFLCWEKHHADKQKTIKRSFTKDKIPLNKSREYKWFKIKNQELKV